MTDALTDLLDTCERVLSERGVATTDELQQAARDAGADLTALGLDDPADFEVSLDGLGDYCSVLLDGRWTYLPTLLDGRILTHRLTAAETAADLIELSPDLDPIDESSDPPRLVDGPELEIGFDHLSTADLSREVPASALSREGTLILPVGALADLGLAAETLIAVRMSPDGVALSRVDEPVGDGTEVVDALRALIVDDVAADLRTVLYTVMADDASAFRTPTVPVGDLVEAAGLARDGDLVAPAGFEFAAFDDAAAADADERWAELTEEEVALIGALAQLADGVAEVLLTEPETDRSEGSDQLTALLSTGLAVEVGAGRTVLDALPLLDEPMVADLTLIHLLGDGFHEAPAVVEMLGLVEPAAPRVARPPLRWMRGRAYERLGEIGEAEEHFRAAERLAPAWPLTLVDLARYAADRGDAPRAIGLLERAGEDADPSWLESLRTQLPEPGPQLGRNDPCWCGSGRKFKQCHLHRPGVAPLAQRVDWLQQKLVHFLAEGPWREVRVELTVRWLTGSPERDHASRMADPLLDDLLLYEGGAIEDFLAVRGSLLPADERALVEQWLEVERSVHTVTAVRPGGGFDARDVRTGAEHTVTASAGLARMAPGQLFCARISPAGEGVERLLGGAVAIGPEDQPVLLELLDARDPVALIDFLRRTDRPAS